LQAYDFLVLFDRYGCMLQMGGDDQWGNIVAGIDLTKKMRKQTVFALTFPLITTARGQKMGKTEAGAIWLDAAKTSPYDFYQYWINCDDRDVVRFLLLFTFLPTEEIEKLGQLQGADIRQAKEKLAFEATLLCHGANEAENAQRTARAAFSKEAGDGTGLPTTTVTKERVATGIPVIDLLVEVGLAPSKSAARRLIEQGGAYINDQKVATIDVLINESSFPNGVCVIRHGKKQHHRVVMG
jgi:tyrosyl-tRNA synthetase